MSMNLDDVSGGVSLRRQSTFRDTATGNPAKWRPIQKLAQKFRTNDASLPRSGWCFWLAKAAWPVRKTTHTSVVTRHQYGISAFLRRDFAGKSVAESRSVGCSLRLLLGPKCQYTVGGGGGDGGRGLWKADLATNWYLKIENTTSKLII